MLLIVQFSAASCYFLLEACFSIDVKDQVSHAYKTRDTVIALFIYIYFFLFFAENSER